MLTQVYNSPHKGEAEMAAVMRAFGDTMLGVPHH